MNVYSASTTSANNAGASKGVLVTPLQQMPYFLDSAPALSVASKVVVFACDECNKLDQAPKIPLLLSQGKENSWSSKTNLVPRKRSGLVSPYARPPLFKQNKNALGLGERCVQTQHSSVYNQRR